MRHAARAAPAELRRSELRGPASEGSGYTAALWLLTHLGEGFAVKAAAPGGEGAGGSPPGMGSTWSPGEASLGEKEARKEESAPGNSGSSS